MHLTKTQAGPPHCLVPGVPFPQNMIADLQHALNLGAFCVLLCFLIQGRLLTVVDIQRFKVTLRMEGAELSGFKANKCSSL